jgi:hypothetical protein
MSSRRICASKDAIKNIENQNRDTEKIYANYTSPKGLYYSGFYRRTK